MNKATIIIVSWNQQKDAERCVKAVLKHNPEEHLIFVDNCSTDGTREWLAKQSFDYVIFDEGIQEYGKILNVVLENFGVAEHLLLLEPRCQVGAETIQRMLVTLEQDEKVGVVGCCGNGLIAPEQQLDISSEKELLAAEKIRRNAPDYRVVGSMGYCFGIPTKVIEEVGAFDDRMADMEGTLDDYQLRVVKAGFANQICRSACVFDWREHEAPDVFRQALRVCDHDVLKMKWNMNYFNKCANLKFARLIEREVDDAFTVLEVGCDMGANLLGIKNMYPNAKICGLEINESAASVGKYVADICYGNIEDENVPFAEKFDYIIFGDVLEHLHNPLKTIEYCRSLLKVDGRILASIPNLMHISVMQQLLRGEFRYTDVGLLDRTHIHLFTEKEIVRMFCDAGYTIEELVSVCDVITEEQRQLEQALLAISTDVRLEMYETYQYTVVAKI